MICLLPHCAYLSETTRMIAIYHALRRRGADAVVATHGGTHEELLRSENVPYEIVGPRMSDERCARFVREGMGMGPPNQSFYSDAELRTYALAETEFFRQRQVRAAVTGFTLTALLSTRLAAIPLVTEHAGSWVPPVFERGMLPAASSPPGPLFPYLPKLLAKWLQNKGAPRLKLYTGGYNRVAAEFGIDGVPSMPALLLGDLTLVTEVPEVLGIPRQELNEWRPAQPSAYRKNARVRYTGPMYAELNLPVPARVDEFLDGPRPIVYVAITSSRPALVRDVVRQVAHVGIRVLVAGTVHALQDLASERVLVEGVLPSHLIMPRVDLAVTAGGQGSVQCAMASGTPLLGIPLQPEQDLNVDLLEKQGAARLVSMRDAVNPQVGRVVMQMIATPQFAENARRIQRIYRRVDGPGACAEAILELINLRPASDAKSAALKEAAARV